MTGKFLLILSFLCWLASGVLYLVPGAWSEMSPLGLVFLALFAGGILFAVCGFIALTVEACRK